MEKEITETLEIQDFLSIKHIKWEFSRFNIITGDMGAGKSLCIKLIEFFEDIMAKFFVMSYNDFTANLNVKTFFNLLKDEFLNTFFLSSDDPDKLPLFNIHYVYKYKEEIFDMTINGKNEYDIEFESIYLEKLLTDWNDKLQKKLLSGNITPDGFEEFKRFLNSDLLNKFDNHFPIVTIFIPASRAALAVSSNYSDKYLRSYSDLVKFLPQFKARNHEIINTILKAKIKYDDDLYLESDDGRKVPITKASSGQQEIIYVLMLLDRLGYFYYTYGKSQSLFIEEPEAHLFPLEQKQTIEFIIHTFNRLKGNGSPTRIFITTHSPYVLNSVNNMLKKGTLLEKYKDKADYINKIINIPSLSINEVSACFINAKGTWELMIDDKNRYFYADKIEDISIEINEITTKLQELNNELMS